MIMAGESYDVHIISYLLSSIPGLSRHEYFIFRYIFCSRQGFYINNLKIDCIFPCGFPISCLCTFLGLKKHLVTLSCNHWLNFDFFYEKVCLSVKTGKLSLRF